MMKRLAGLLLAVPLAVTLVACSDSGDGAGVATAGGAAPAASASAQLSDDEHKLEFAQCMRDNGIEFEDPGEGNMPRFGADVDPQKVQAALEKCRDLMPNGGEAPTLDAEQVEQTRRLAKCMRENGVPDFPDPDPDGRIQMDRSVDPNDPDVEAALRKCEQYAPDFGGGR